MLTSTSTGVSRITAASGDKDCIVRPLRTAGGLRRGIVMPHAGGIDGMLPVTGLAADGTTTASGTKALIDALTGVGYPLVTSDQGGTTPWCGTTAQARTGDMVTTVQSSTGGGASSSAVVALGVSMGFGCAVNYFGKSPGHASDVAALVGIIPVWDMDAIYQANTYGYTRAQIETAWGITYPTALPAGADPKGNTTLLNGKPVLICYSSDDGICNGTVPAAAATAFGSNCTLVNLGALGHTNAAVTAAIPTVLSWLRTNAAP